MKIRVFVLLIFTFGMAFALVSVTNVGQVVGGNARFAPQEKTNLDLAREARTASEKINYLELYQRDVESITDVREQFDAVQLFHQAGILFPEEYLPYFPEKVNWEEYDIASLHKHGISDQDVPLNEFFLTLKSGPNGSQSNSIPLQLFGAVENLKGVSRPPAYILNGKGYLGVSSVSPTIYSNAEGKETLTQGVPYNHAVRKMIVLVPYNATTPLDPNYLSFVTALGNANREYYLKNSEGGLIINFDVQAVQVSTAAYDASGPFPHFTPDFDLIIFESDSTVDYSKYDFAMVMITTDDWEIGWAGINYDFITQKPAFFQTNEPIAGIRLVNIFSNSTGLPTPHQQSIFQHEIGHILTYWAPDFDYSYYIGLIPHSNGLHFPSCVITPENNKCYSKEYGNHFDVMGLGNGLFNQHTAVFRAGLRSVNSVKEITQSGVYELCSINNEPSPSTDSCPRELLIKNPLGLDIALEFRSPKYPESLLISSDGCAANQLEGLIVYGANPEEGSKFGKIVVKTFGEVALSNVIDPITCSSGKTIYQYSIPIGGALEFAELQNFVVSTISLVSIVTTNPITGDRKAQVLIDYTPIECDDSPVSGGSSTVSAIGCPLGVPSFGM
jgi:hypothetical protein